jgi:hypothetical protein
MQPRRSAPKEGDNVTAALDLGRVMAILYSWLATSLRSLAIMFPIYVHLLSLASTFATVSYNYETYAYEAERWRTCPYNATAKKIRICARSKRWWNADIKERRRTVGRERRRRRHTDEATRATAQLQMSIRQSKRRMWGD